MKEKLCFKLFDGLKIYCTKEQCWKSIDDFSDKGIGKKQQLFLTYLILNHRRRITASELIDHFWAEKGDSPANSLKNMLYKTRKLLHLVFPDCEELIITHVGGYEWNKHYEIETDIELFEQYYRNLDCLTQKGRKKALEAFELYTGDILPGVSVEWLDHSNTYYRAIYIDFCKSMATRLQDEERWNVVLDICKQAYTLAPEVEEFTTCAMNACIATNMPKQAIEQYEEYRDMLMNQYNLVPSGHVEEIHTLAEEMYREEDGVEEKLVQRFMMLSEEAGSFQCGMLVFQNIVQLELRHMKRNNENNCIVLLHAETMGMEYPSATDVRRLERILKSSLRAGDPFTRLNRGSFAILLSGASEEDSKRIIARIERDFYSTYTRTRASLSYKIYPLSI